MSRFDTRLCGPRGYEKRMQKHHHRPMTYLFVLQRCSLITTFENVSMVDVNLHLTKPRSYGELQA